MASRLSDWLIAWLLVVLPQSKTMFVGGVQEEVVDGEVRARCEITPRVCI